MIKNRKELKRRIACLSEIKTQSAQEVRLETKMIKFRVEQYFLTEAIKKVMNWFV